MQRIASLFLLIHAVSTAVNARTQSPAPNAACDTSLFASTYSAAVSASSVSSFLMYSSHRRSSVCTASFCTHWCTHCSLTPVFITICAQYITFSPSL